MRQRLVHVGGRRLRIRTGGSGPGLLVLHGFASGIDGWPEHELEALSASRTLLALDLPGHGGSDAAPVGSLSSEAIVELVVEVARQEFGAGPLDWYGYSMGARVALSALRLGVPIRTLWLESANPGVEDEAERRARVQWDASWAERFEKEDPDEVLDDWLQQPIFATRNALGPDALAHQRAVREAADPASLGTWLREFGTGTMPPAWRALVDSEVPLHLLVGELDPRYVALAERIVARRSDARLTVAPGAGHAPHMETPSIWYAWLAGSEPDA